MNCKPNGRFIYRKFEFLESSGTWRGKSVYPPRPPELARAKVLALGHSDSSPSWKQIAKLKLGNPQLQIWSSNLERNLLRNLVGVDQLPLGLSNPTSESRHHQVAGNLDVLRAVWQGRVEPTWQMYANFRPSTNPGARAQLLDDCRQSDIVHVGRYEISEKGRRNDLEKMAHHGLVLCPEGNGLDTHRMWEALYLGGIPIVLRKSYQYKLLSRLRLPAIGVISWKQLLSKDFRPTLALEKMKLANYRVDALRGSFWIQRILKETAM